MKLEPMDGLTKLVKNELIGGPAENEVEQVLVDGDGSASGGCNVVESVRSWWLGWLRWRRWWPGVFGGVEWWELGSSTQRALTWKSLCVSSSEDNTHRGSLLSV